MINRTLIFTFLLCLVSSTLLAQNLELNYGIKSYPIQTETKAQMPYLDSIVEDYNHFFMDEYHGKSITENLKKQFVYYLAKNKGLDKIVMEEPYAYGYWVNQYLATGDTVLLRNFLTNYYLTDYGKSDASRVGEYYDFFEWVYNLNSKQETKIRVEGIDVNFVNLKSDFWTLKQFFEEYQLAEDFPKAYNKIVKLESRKKVRSRPAKRWLKKFNQNRTAKEEVLKNKLKDDLIHFENIISNLSNSLKMHTLYSYFFSPTGYRDSLMHIQYMQQVKPDEVAFSQFGGWHMLSSMGEKVQKLWGYNSEFKSFTSLVNNEKEYAGKCLSIQLIYGEKEYSFGSGGYFFSFEEYNELKSKVNYQEVLLDFRDATGPYSTIAEYYQIAIFLNGIYAY
jgi:hypothetical protein